MPQAPPRRRQKAKTAVRPRARLAQEWPFTVELLDLSSMTVDLRYQRPKQEIFVARLIENFDERLVGTLDVSAREDGTNAILDGAQRFHVIGKFKKTAWCAVYRGMSLADEAKHFYEINRNRRSVHPFYEHQALMVTGDRRARAIDKIVRNEDYKLGIGAAQDDVLTAIRAVDEAYALKSLARKESLTPALRIMHACFFGRKAGKEGTLIRGLGRFFQPFTDDEIDWAHLASQLENWSPQQLIGRATDKADASRDSRSFHLARHVCEIYNRNLPRGAQRLFPSAIEKRG